MAIHSLSFIRLRSFASYFIIRQKNVYLQPQQHQLTTTDLPQNFNSYKVLYGFGMCVCVCVSVEGYTYGWKTVLLFSQADAYTQNTHTHIEEIQQIIKNKNHLRVIKNVLSYTFYVIDSSYSKNMYRVDHLMRKISKP